MQQWEYKTVMSSSVLKEQLLEHGREGWQLAAFVAGTLIFQRPIGPNWKERCEAAEAVIQVSVPDDRIKTAKQSEAYKRWMEFKK